MNHKKKYDLNVSFDNKYFQWLKRIEKKYPVRLYISLIAIGLFFTMYTVRVIVTSRLGFLSEPTSDYSWFFNYQLLIRFILIIN